MKTVPQYIREKSTFFGVYEISSPTASIEVSSWLNDPDTRKRLEKLPDQHIFEIHEEEDVPIALFLLKLKSEGLYPDFDKNKPVLRSIIQNTSDDKISNALKVKTTASKMYVIKSQTCSCSQNRQRKKSHEKSTKSLAWIRRDGDSADTGRSFYC